MPHGDCDTRAQCDYARDEAATLAGDMSPEEFTERMRWRGIGAMIGVAPFVAAEAGAAATIARITLHGSTRLAGANAMRGGVLSYTEAVATRLLATSRYTASNGAQVYVRAIGNGRFNISIWGQRGFMTGLRHARANDVARWSARGGWR